MPSATKFTPQGPCDDLLCAFEPKLVCNDPLCKRSNTRLITLVITRSPAWSSQHRKQILYEPIRFPAGRLERTQGVATGEFRFRVLRSQNGPRMGPGLESSAPLVSQTEKTHLSGAFKCFSRTWSPDFQRSMPKGHCFGEHKSCQGLNSVSNMSKLSPLCSSLIQDSLESSSVFLQ